MCLVKKFGDQMCLSHKVWGWKMDFSQNFKPSSINFLLKNYQTEAKLIIRWGLFSALRWGLSSNKSPRPFLELAEKMIRPNPCTIYLFASLPIWLRSSIWNSLHRYTHISHSDGEREREMKNSSRELCSCTRPRVLEFLIHCAQVSHPKP